MSRPPKAVIDFERSGFVFESLPRRINVMPASGLLPELVSPFRDEPADPDLQVVFWAGKRRSRFTYL